jgi:restriction endonuclease S subunit
VRKGWEEKKLSEILTLEYGKPLPPALRNPTGKYAVYGANGIKDRSDKFYVDRPSIIVGRKGSAGEITLTEDKFWPLDVTYFVTFDKTKYDLQFLFHLLSLQELTKLAKGVKPGINRNEVYQRTVSVPLLPEQQRIVALLEEAFEGLATATANAQKNLKNARELFESYLTSVFDQSKPLNLPSTVDGAEETVSWTASPESQNASSVRTGGRAATTRRIEGKRSLCVGMPKLAARNGWTWRALDSLARMESGHTPSRRHPEYWGGDVPWIGIRDAKAAHGRKIFETTENTNAVGLENSSARLLPAQTVCLSRTASVGYATVMGRPMATSQDFVNWVCSKDLYPPFLMYLFLGQGDEIFKFSSGAVHQTIYFPEAKAFHICLPWMKEQRRIVEALDALREQTEKLEAHYRRKIDDLTEAKQAILQKAFSGELTSPPSQAVKEAAE